MDNDVALDLLEFICSKIELQHKMIIVRDNITVLYKVDALKLKYLTTNEIVVCSECCQHTCNEVFRWKYVDQIHVYYLFMYFYKRLHSCNEVLHYKCARISYLQ